MPDDSGKALPQPAPKKFPALLLIAATVFLYVLGFYGKRTVVLSLAEFTLTLSLFLALMMVLYEVKKLEFAKINIKKLFKKKDAAPEAVEVVETAQAEKIEESVSEADGLITIRKETVSAQRLPTTNYRERILEAAYIVFLCALAFWRIRRMFAGMNTFAAGGISIVDAVLALVFPGIAAIYLKMRADEGSFPCAKTSGDMLRLFSAVSCIYAAIIAVSSALKINALILLPWVYCIASWYLAAALAFNVLISLVKNNIAGDFNYTLIPRITKSKEKKDGLFDSDEVRQNFSLKSLYTIQYALHIMPGVLLGLFFVLFLSTMLFVVQPHQQALVYRWGKLNSSVVGEGVHFKLPWPIDKADVYDVRRVNSMQIGYESPYSAHYLWTRAHDGGENTLLLGNGNEMAAVNIKIMYTISDLSSYVKNNTRPEAVLSAAAYEALMLRTVDTTLDAFLSVDRSSLSASVAEELAQFCRLNGLGLSIVQVIVESIHPPVDIADIYQRVVTALVVKDTIITRAHTEAERRIIKAQQESRTLINNAFAREHNRVSEAIKEMAVYYAAMEAYQINPRSFELTKYLNTYEKIIGGNKVYVFSPGMEAGIAKSVIGNKANVNVIGVNNE